MGLFNTAQRSEDGKGSSTSHRFVGLLGNGVGGGMWPQSM